MRSSRVSGGVVRTGVVGGSWVCGALLAAVWAGAVAVAPASGQMRVGDDGRATEANPRVGSGGYNSPRPNLQLASPNDIVLGNVTGGSGFRGNITRDASQPFGGRSNLPSDRFLRRSAPGGSSSAPPLPPGTNALPFYSSSPVGNAPGGFMLNPYTGQYVQAPKTVMGGEDIQYGTPPGTPVIRPGADGSQQLILPAMTRDANGAVMPMTLTATPLLGIRPMSALSDEERFLLQRSIDPRRGPDTGVDPATLRKLRQELQQTLASDPLLAERFRQAEVKAQTEQESRTSPLQRSADLTGRPTDTSLGGAPAQITPGPSAPGLSPGLTPAQTPGLTPGLTPGAPGLAPGAAVRPGGMPSDVTDRSPLVRELRRLEEQRRQATPPATPSGAAPAAPSGGTTPPPTTGPSGSGTDLPRSGSGLQMRTGLPVTSAPESLGYVPPIKISSLAERQGSEGLKQLVGGAEKLMGEGRFASAADRYEAAGRFSPGDATLVVARAQAELASGFFARAETGLRQAVASDPSVLGAQYDLRKAIGDARVDKLVEDLKRIAVEDKDSAMPVTLLAYLAYNGGDESRAVSLLGEAAARQPGDPLVSAMRARWGTPAGAGEGK